MKSTGEYKQKLLSGVYNFEEMAFEVFKYQYAENKIYSNFCNYLGRTPRNTHSLTNIPFLPIELFKSQKIVSGKNENYRIFESSGTTGGLTSKHYVADEFFYHKNCKDIFEASYGDTTQHALLFLLPSYLERGNSSLVSMAKHLLENNTNKLSGFYLNNYSALEKQIKEAIDKNEKIILLGVTFGLLDFLEQLSSTLEYHKLTIMETGGMKGRRKELTRDEVHKLLLSKVNVPAIHSEYGMTELLSQIYSFGEGIFAQNNKIKVFIRELQDPLAVRAAGKGGINVIDLANIDSISFIATQDQGEILENGNFKVTGRIDHSDIRGCNLMTV